MKLSTKSTIETNTKSKLFTSIYSLETRNKMRDAKIGSKNPNYGKLAEQHPNWKGGSYTYFHQKAKELHNTDVCMKCGLKLKDKTSNQAFDAHCWGDYKNLKKSNWTIICRSCHKSIHSEIDKLKF